MITLASYNSKTGMSLHAPMRFCKPTPICAKYCYAKKGPISWGASVKKSEEVYQYIKNKGPEKSAQRLSYEITTTIFRFNDMGDFDDEGLIVETANILSGLRQDVRIGAFSKKLDQLKNLVPAISKVYSIDASSVHQLGVVPNTIKVAYLKIDPQENIPSRVDIILPLNHKKGLINSDPRLCPFYNGIKCQTCKKCY